MWLYFPYTVLIHRAAFDPRPTARLWTWGTLATAVVLMCLSIPIFPNDLQAYGNNLAATAVLAAGLVWHILHPSEQDTASSIAPAALQPAS
jgi:hypothetical protein